MKDNYSKRTKIVATIGPAVSTKEAVANLIKAGANVFRLNSSHGSLDDHREKFNLIRKVSNELGVYCAIMIDLQGPKIRVGSLIADMELKKNQKVVFSHMQKQIDDKIIPVDYEGISNDVKKGSRILLDDGKIIAIVDEVNDKRVCATVVNGGILKSRKGLNIPGSTASLSACASSHVRKSPLFRPA